MLFLQEVLQKPTLLQCLPQRLAFVQWDPEERGRISDEVGISPGPPSLRGAQISPFLYFSIFVSLPKVKIEFYISSCWLLPAAMHSDISNSFLFFNAGGNSVDVFYKPLMGFPGAWASMLAQTGRNLPAIQETQV